MSMHNIIIQTCYINLLYQLTWCWYLEIYGILGWFVSLVQSAPGYLGLENGVVLNMSFLCKITYI